MRNILFNNSMNQLKKKHDGASKTMWNTSWEIDRSQIQRILCRICQGCNMSLKLHFLHSHLGYFPQNLSSVSENFRQDIREMEKRYEGGWTVNMKADYSWMLTRDSTCVESCGRRANQANFHLS
jgi:hypothetical protein